MVDKLEVLVDGGKATPGPPLGPALGPLGVNVIQVVGAINEKTKAFVGMKVPVTLTIDPKTKEFEIKVGTPPTTALIMKELGLEKGSGKPNSDFVGNLTVKQVTKIADMKKDSMLAKDKKGRFKEVVGTCVSMGVTVDGKNPRKIIADIDAGEYQGLF
ncbi:MAG TPA: 50S ribosomal protein L11 [Thermoplasmata archaeon]|nr:50S ribosomal protein L11 [Thermoplasmata archaeon]